MSGHDMVEELLGAEIEVTIRKGDLVWRAVGVLHSAEVERVFYDVETDPLRPARVPLEEQERFRMELRRVVTQVEVSPPATAIEPPRRHDPADHACVGGVPGDRYPL